MPYSRLDLNGHTNTTPVEQPEALRALFKQLSAGQTPNFIEMMSAISSMVAFSTDTDSNSEDLSTGTQKRSGKKCRFCS